MSAEANKTIIRRRVEEIWNQGDVAIADELIADDYLSDGRTIGREGYKQFVAGVRAAFPDLRFTLDDLVAEGDRVAVRYTARGTHSGAFMGIPPTGKQVTFTGIDLFRIAHGRMAEEWLMFDQLGLLRQLGAVPTQG
jgi:steroid delta-isomerase-like uncharacterized protein